jgi:hypothetical protein
MAPVVVQRLAIRCGRLYAMPVENDVSICKQRLPLITRHLEKTLLKAL